MSADVIKPWLRGRDVKRWRVDSQDLYLIAVQNSGDADADNPWAKVRNEAEARTIFRTSYPAVRHLSQFEEALRVRQDQGRWWWELRACAYYARFKQPKIIYSDIAHQPQFVYDDENFFSGNTCYIIPDGDVCLTGILNSKVIEYFYGSLSPQIQAAITAFHSICSANSYFYLIRSPA